MLASLIGDRPTVPFRRGAIADSSATHPGEDGGRRSRDDLAADEDVAGGAAGAAVGAAASMTSASSSAGESAGGSMYTTTLYGSMRPPLAARRRARPTRHEVPSVSRRRRGSSVGHLPRQAQRLRPARPRAAAGIAASAAGRARPRAGARSGPRHRHGDRAGVRAPRPSARAAASTATPPGLRPCPSGRAHRDSALVQTVPGSAGPTGRSASPPTPECAAPPEACRCRSLAARSRPGVAVDEIAELFEVLIGTGLRRGYFPLGSLADHSAAASVRRFQPGSGSSPCRRPGS